MNLGPAPCQSSLVESTTPARTSSSVFRLTSWTLSTFLERSRTVASTTYRSMSFMLPDP